MNRNTSKTLSFLLLGTIGFCHSSAFAQHLNISELAIVIAPTNGPSKSPSTIRRTKQVTTNTSVSAKPGNASIQNDQIIQRLLAIEKQLGIIQQRTPIKLSERMTSIEVKLDSLLTRMEALTQKIEAVSNAEPTTEEEVVEKVTTKLSPRDAWRKLKRGMAYEQVKLLIGEPDRISAGSITLWFYMGGNVMFMDDRVSNWSEPRF